MAHAIEATRSESPLDWTDLPHAQVPRVLHLVERDDTNQTLWRTAWPCQYAAAHGLVADWCTMAAIDSIAGWIASGRYTMVITPRMTWRAAEAAVHWAEAIERDRLVWIYESDDDIWTPAFRERHELVFGGEHEQAEQARQWRVEMLRKCDGILVSRPELRSTVRSFSARPIALVPNAIDVGWFRGRLAGHERTSEPIVIGWSGALRTQADLAVLGQAWGIVAARHPSVRFMVQGNVHAHALINAVPSERLTIVPWTSVEDHPATLLDMDIACCAMEPTRWNSCKSPNKWFEHSLAGAPCVVSPTVYGDVVEHGEDALVASSIEEWAGSLSLLVEDAELRRAINERAQATIEREHDMRQQWRRWPAAWIELQKGARRR